MNNDLIKFKFTEDALKILAESGRDPKLYKDLDPRQGLSLFNMGEDVTIPGRNKFIVFKEKISIIRTGIKLVYNEKYVPLLKESSGILRSSLVLRSEIVDYTEDQIYISLINVGELDVTIPKGCLLPVRLMFVSCCENIQPISDFEYLKEVANSSAQKP